MKKRTIFANLALAAALVMSPNAVSAQVGTEGAGTWDTVAWEDGYFYTGVEYTFSKVVPSGGGDFALEFIRNDGGGQFRVELWETDDNGQTGTYVRYANTNSDGMAIFRDIGGSVDGSNNQAEFFVKITKISGPNGTAVWNYLD